MGNFDFSGENTVLSRNKTDLLRKKERLEASIIGCLLFNPELTHVAIQRLPPECFQKEERDAYVSIKKLYDENNLSQEMLSSVMVHGNLNLHKYEHIGMLYNSSSMIYECERLMDLHVTLELEKITKEAVSGAMVNGFGIEKADELISKLEELVSLKENFYPETSFDEALPGYIAKIEEEALAPLEDNTLRFKKLYHFNIATNGIRKQNLIVLAGAWKAGKTTLALEMLCDLAVNSGCKVGYMSLEVTERELTEKILSTKLNIPYAHLRQPQMLTPSEKEKLNEAGKLMNRTKIFLFAGSLNEEQVKARIKSWVKRHGVECVFIDYVNLIGVSRKLRTREEEISYLSRMLKTLATELNICIIALTQLNRASLQNNDFSAVNLSESVALARDCNYLFSIKRPAETDRGNNKPYEDTKAAKSDKVEKEYCYKGKTYPAKNIFEVCLDASRHSQQGIKFPLMLVEGELIELESCQED